MNMENKVHFEAEIYSQIFDLDKWVDDNDINIKNC